MAETEKIQFGKKESPVKKQFDVVGLFNSIIENKYTGIYFALFYLIVMMLVSLSFHKIGDYGVETDFYQSYVPAAQEFLNGIIKIDYFRGPLYQIVLGIAGFIFSDFFKAGIIINVFSASFVLYLTFLLTKKIFTAKIASLTTLLVMFNPVFIQYTYRAGTDLFFAAILTASFYFLFKDLKIKIVDLIFAAFLGGLAYLTRYNGVIILGYVFILLFVNYSDAGWKKRITYSFIFLATFLLTISPWSIYTFLEKGSFFFNENYKNIAYELFGKDKIPWDQFWYSYSSQFTSISDVILKNPGLFLSNTLKNIYTHFTGDMGSLLGWQIGVFVIPGIVFAFFNIQLKEWKSRQNAYILMNLFFFTILLLVFYSERFSLFLIPFYLVIALNGFWNGNKSLSKITSQKLVLLILVLLFGYSFINSYDYNKSRINSGPVEILKLKKWFDENIPLEKRGEKIAARKPHIAYYLGMKFDIIPFVENYEQLIDELRKNQDDYLYFGMVEAQYRPQLDYLLDPEVNHPNLEPIYYIEDPPAVLYKVEKVKSQ